MDLSLKSWPRGLQRLAEMPTRERIEHLIAQRWTGVTINFLALVLLAASAAHWTWQWLAPATPPTALPAAAISDGEYNLQTLLSANLFGHAAIVERSLDNIPLSGLNLVLTGVMVTPAGSFALISANGGPEMPFTIDQDIVAGAVLRAVYADRVLIRRAGSTESLMLKETVPALPGGAITMATAAPATADSVTNTGINSYSIAREQVNQQMRKPEFLRQALMVPNAGGGFLVREIQPGSLYEKLGLRAGDVIQSVNGQLANTMGDVMKFYQQLENGQTSDISIDVRRAGKNETLRYHLQ